MCLFGTEAWLPGSERLIPGVNFPQEEPTPLCMVCQDREAVGMLTEAPDGVKLFGKNFACERCCVRPVGWPSANHMNLKAGCCKGCLGHTIFAVALNQQLDNFGAFTTEDIPVRDSERHRGIFFDGKIRKVSECKPKRHLVIIDSRSVLEKKNRWCIDGFGLIRDYKQEQTNILGVLWENPYKTQHGAWTNFLQLAGKSIIFHLPKHLRYRGSAHLTNSSKGEIRNIPNMVQRGFNPSGIQPQASFDVAGDNFVCPYLKRGSGVGEAKKGMQLLWQYEECEAGEDRDRQTVTAPNLPRVSW